VLKKLLIANRGEIAARVVRTCRLMNIRSVAVFADDDRDALYVGLADEAVALRSDGGTLPYLDIEAVLTAARESGADSVHPGYGFLSESPAFAQAVMDAGLHWVGPDPTTIALLGDKREARRAALAAGLSVVPGLHDGVVGTEDVVSFGRDHGWPIVVKAAHGGGGRGLRVIPVEVDAASLVASAQRESQAAFGSDALLVERFVDDGRHIEVQVLGDRRGNVLAIGDRECSVQRRHQKLVEEAPATAIEAGLRARLAEEAVRLMREVGYVGAGTVEFLVSAKDAYFLEVNTRLQVEHPVTEAVYGVDLVAEQLRIAAGEAISMTAAPIARGHAIEVRVAAEDPHHGFVPESGALDEFFVPELPGIRVDAGYRAGDVVPARYDSLLAKVIIHRTDREQARRGIVEALRATTIGGLPSTTPALLAVLEHPDFGAQQVSTEWFERSVEPWLRSGTGGAAEGYDDTGVVVVSGGVVRLPQVIDRAAYRRPTRREPTVATTGLSEDNDEVLAPMNGTVVAVHVQEGDALSPGNPLVTIEAMKMENVVRAASRRVVAALDVSAGDEIRRGDRLIRLV